MIHQTASIALFLLMLVTLSGGCSSPTEPDPSGGIVTTGQQLLRVAMGSRAGPPCTMPGIAGAFQMAWTRIHVTVSGSEWFGAATSAAGGDVVVRFHQSGQPSLIAGTMEVAGTISGTAIHQPELFQGPAWQSRISFSNSATLSGVAFAAGALGFPASGIDGLGTGTLTLTDGNANSCSGTEFSWSIFSLP